ncbi:MAG: nucleotide exchange factor GrpE [Thermovirgaceae bacterium]
MASTKNHNEKNPQKEKNGRRFLDEGQDLGTRESKGDEKTEEIEKGAEKAVEAELVEETPPVQNAEAEALRKEIEKTRTLIEELRSENETLRDAVARGAADFYNFRKRVERESEKTRARIAARTAEILLPVLDNLDRALDSGDGGGATGLRKGVEMVREQFFGVLRELGVQTIEAEGKPFDPNLHEAVAVEENSGAPDGTVVEEFQRGFLLGGTVLRASKVKVARGPEHAEESEKQEQ